MMTLDQEATLALRAAVQNGVVDTIMHPFSAPLTGALLAYISKAQKEHRQDPNAFEAYQHPRSTSFQSNSLAAFVPPSDAYQALEVARFVVPKGQVGYIEYIEQDVSDEDGSYYPTNQAYWGSPTSTLADVDGIRWWLKLDFYDGLEPARFARADNIPFGSELAPGMPYSEMHEIDALWYPAHLSKKLKLIVPGQRMLRLYYYSPPLITYTWKIRARLSGYTQSTYCPEAIANARFLK